jgi:PmbA protein
MSIKPKHNRSALSKSTTEGLPLILEVIKLAQQAGASDVAVAMDKERGFSVDVRMGSVETVAFHEEQSLGLTVYMGQRKGSASGTDTSASALKTLVDAACEIAKVSSEDPCFGLADKKLMTKTHPNLSLYHPWQLSPEEAIELALNCESLALTSDKRIRNSDGVNVSSYETCHYYANTHGGQGEVQATRHQMSASFIAQVGEDMQREYEYSLVRDPVNLLSKEVIAKTAVERAISRLGASQLKTQKAAVVFSPRVSAGLFSSFINAISGSNLYRKNSFLLDSLNQSIFPEFIHIYEQPHLLGALGSAPFDGEGVPTRANCLVEKGILKQYVLGSYSARRLGLETTANADGVHNLTIEPNVKDLSAILSEMKRGFLVTELMGQGVNGITGDYSRGASGYWVEDGYIQFPVDRVTIAGNLKDMFQQILAVGADRNLNMSTRCGSVWIKEMMIAGK